MSARISVLETTVCLQELPFWQPLHACESCCFGNRCMCARVAVLATAACVQELPFWQLLQVCKNCHFSNYRMWARNGPHMCVNVSGSPLTHTGRIEGHAAEFRSAGSPQISTSLAAFAGP